MVESDFCANTGRADRGARSVDLWGGRGFCILGGAAGLTLDVDHSGEPSNLARLLPILEALDAIYRIQRRLRPTVNHLASPGRQNLVTRYGLVDLAGTVGRNLGYPECCPTREKMDIGEGARVRVLDLETLIVSKRATAAKETTPYGRSSGGRSPRRKRRGGRLDSSSLSSLFDRGAQAKRVVLEIDGRGCRTPSPKRLQQPQSTYLPPQTEAKGWPLCVGLWKREIGAPFASHPPAVVFDGFLDGGVFFGKTHQLQPDRVD